MTNQQASTIFLDPQPTETKQYHVGADDDVLAVLDVSSCDSLVETTAIQEIGYEELPNSSQHHHHRHGQIAYPAAPSKVSKTGPSQ